MTTCELWFCELLGVCGVRLEGGRVTGVYGPLPLALIARSDPLRLRYDERSEVIRRVESGPEQLCMLVQWRKSQWWSGRSTASPGIVSRALTQLRLRPRARA